MINDSENEAKNEKQFTQVRIKINLGLDVGTNILKTKCVSVTTKQHFKLNYEK